MKWTALIAVLLSIAWFYGGVVYGKSSAQQKSASKAVVGEMHAGLYYRRQDGVITLADTPLKPEENPLKAKEQAASGLHLPMPTLLPIPILSHVTVTSLGSHLAQSKLTVAEKNISAISSRHYTVQLLGVRHFSEVSHFFNVHNLHGKASYYHTTHKGKNWYVVIYGDYSSAQAAENAIKQMPASLRRMNPWVKSFTDVKADIKEPARARAIIAHHRH